MNDAIMTGKWFSQFSFSYVEPLLEETNNRQDEKQVDMKDLGQLPASFQVNDLFPKLENEWNWTK